MTLNGQDFTVQQLAFTYYQPQEPAVLDPLFGPVRGGTVITLRGAYHSASSEPTCRFGGSTGEMIPSLLTRVPADSSVQPEITCAVPAAIVGATPTASQPAPLMVEFSLNGQQFVSAVQPFTYHYPMQSVEIVPSAGPVAGDTDVLLRVSGVSLSSWELQQALKPSLRCRFHDLEQPAIWSSMPPRFNESTLINATNTSMINDTQDDSNSTGVNASNMTCMYPNASTIAPDVCGPLSVLILHCVSPAAVAIRDGAKQLSMAASLNRQEYTSSDSAFKYG